jgi:hypothetical protein
MMLCNIAVALVQQTKAHSGTPAETNSTCKTADVYEMYCCQSLLITACMLRQYVLDAVLSLSQRRSAKV